MTLLEKGTYYISFASGLTVKCTLVPQSSVNKNNYCKAKAASLPANTWVEIANTPNHFYTRWYKIKLTKKKAVRIMTNDKAGYNVAIYNSRMRKISVATGSKTVITQNKLPKGTYYIRVGLSNYLYGEPEYLFTPYYIRLRWK